MIKDICEENELECNGIICIDSFEISKRNVADISVYDKQKCNITRKVNSITLEINREGIIPLATMLLVFLDNYKDGKEYRMLQSGSEIVGYNFGVILTKDSVPTVLKIDDIGRTSDFIALS